MRKSARFSARLSKAVAEDTPAPEADDRLNAEIVKKKIRAAAYDAGGVSWKKLFNEYDKDSSGAIDLEEFKSAIRKGAKVKDDEISDKTLTELFQYVDKNKDNLLQYESEFLSWLDPNGVAKKKKIDEMNARSVLKKATDTDEPIGMDKTLSTAGKLIKRAQDAAKKAGQGGTAPGGKAELKPEVLATIKNKLRVAAYHHGKVNWAKLFRYYDRDNSGEINFDEFRQAIRKDAKVTPEMLSEHKLRALYKMVDKDGGGTIHYETEFVAWLEEPDPPPEPKKKKVLAEDFAKLEMQRIQEIGMLGAANAAYVRAKTMLPFLLRWMNYLVEDAGKFTMSNFAKELQSGLLLIDIVRILVPGADFGPGIYNRPISRPMCISNLYKAIGAACRHSINMGNMCRPDDFYEGRVMQIARALFELFEALQMRTVKIHIRKYLREMDSLLAPMGRPLQEKTLHEPLIAGHYMLTDFGDCVRMFALLVACGKATPDEMAELYGNPKTSEEFVHNAKCTNRALAMAGCPVLLEGQEWCAPPAWDFNIMGCQIYETWERLRYEDQNVGNDLSGFQFRDGEPLRLSARAIRDAVAKAYDATRRAQEAEPELPPLFRGARVFGNYIHELGDEDKVWEYFDTSGNGSVSMTEFADGARRVGFKGNVKAVFNLIDCNRSGQIERDELFNFIDAAVKPRTEEEINREMAFNEMDRLQRLKEQRMNAGLPPDQKPKRKARKRQHDDKALDSAGVIEFVKLVKRFKTIDEAFECFDVFGTGTITLIEFDDVAHKLHLKADAKKVFAELDLNRSGMIDKKEFIALVADMEKKNAEERLHGRARLELLVELPQDHHKVWPTPSAFEVAMIQDLGELRIPSAAEEREALMTEDDRRSGELYADGFGRLVERIKLGVADAIRAAEEKMGEEDSREIDIQEISMPHDEDYYFDEESMGQVSANVTPTVSVAARVVCEDSSEQPVWLQTAVVDSTGAGRIDYHLSIFVLEIRTRGPGDSAVLLAQLDVALIDSIEQLGSLDERDQKDADIEFVITAQPEAKIGGDEDALGESIPILQSPDGLSVISLLGGPSYWRRREAVHFFDELRILAHFIRGDGSQTARSSPLEANFVEKSVVFQPVNKIFQFETDERIFQFETDDET